MEPSQFQRRWEERGGRRRGKTATAEAKSSYYGVPVIHGAHWNWAIITYFFLGGISGASYVIASIARIAGGTEAAPIARAGRYLSLLALLPCPLLLVIDLGRPERFLNMLRVVKFRSPMSLGSWGLTLFSAFSGISALIQASRDGLLGGGRAANQIARLPDAQIGAAGIAPACFLGGYTGVLLGATAVPLWAKSARWLGPLFLNSGFSAATSALSLIVAAQRGVDDATVDRLEALDRILIGSELALLTATKISAGEAATAIETGRLGQIARYGVAGAGLAAPLAINMVNRRLRSRGLTSVASVLVLAGGFALRYVAVTGGRVSADDPAATFAFTRRK